jgi:NADH:ubiquinone oxidoreductase subunit K
MSISPLALGVLGLLGVGFYALVVSKNLIRTLIALQILVKSAVLGLLLAGSLSGKLQLAQSLAVTAIVADTVVAVVGMAFAVQIRRRMGTLDLRDLAQLRG